MGGSVWDCEQFLKGNIDDYPFSYDRAIIYRGCSEQIFFKNEHTLDRRHEQVSVLKKGYLSAQNGYGDRYSKEEVRSGNHAIAEPGVFCGYYETALSYARDVVLKLEVPTEHLEVIATPEEDLVKGGDRPRTYGVSNNEQLDRIYGSPERMRFISQKSMEINSGGVRIDYIMFKVDREVPLGTRREPGDLEENWIKGVYDKNISDKPVFEPLKTYIRHMKALKPDKLPAGINDDSLKKEIMDEIKLLEEILEKIEGLKQDAKEISQILNACRELSENNPALRQNLERSCRNYRSGLEDLQNKVKQHYGIDLSFKKPGSEVLDTDKLIDSFEGLENELEEMIETEKQHLRKVANESYNLEDYRDESQIEEQMDREVVRQASTIPDMSAVNSRELVRELLEA